MANLANYKQFAKVFSPIFTAFNRIAYGFRLPIAKHIRYGLLFMIVYSLLAYRHQACNTVVMYFYNKLTITSNLCHEALCHDSFRDSPIITRKLKLRNEDNTALFTSNQWLLKTGSFLFYRVLHYTANC